MNKPNHRNSGLREYLKKLGILDRGNIQEIKSAKKAYQKRYQREYKKNRRAEFPEVTVTLDRASYNRLKKEAKRHDLTLASFLREATLHYLKRKYLVPDVGLLIQFAQRLRICASDINLIAKHVKKLNQPELYESYISLSERIQHLEKYVVNTLNNPPLYDY